MRHVSAVRSCPLSFVAALVILSPASSPWATDFAQPGASCQMGGWTSGIESRGGAEVAGVFSEGEELSRRHKDAEGLGKGKDSRRGAEDAEVF